MSQIDKLAELMHRANNAGLVGKGDIRDLIKQAEAIITTECRKARMEGYEMGVISWTEGLERVEKIRAKLRDMEATDE